MLGDRGLTDPSLRGTPSSNVKAPSCREYSRSIRPQPVQSESIRQPDIITPVIGLLGAGSDADYRAMPHGQRHPAYYSERNGPPMTGAYPNDPAHQRQESGEEDATEVRHRRLI